MFPSMPFHGSRNTWSLASSPVGPAASDAESLPAEFFQDSADGPTETPKGTPMGLFSHWIARFRSIIRAVNIAIDPGEDADDLAPESVPGRPSRVMLTHDDLLWFKTSEDDEGRITLGLLECSPRSIGVLVDDNGDSLGLRLSRAEAQDLHRSLVVWLANSARTMTS
jgi:hypothetical protein